jgi:hypothetical protein
MSINCNKKTGMIENKNNDNNNQTLKQITFYNNKYHFTFDNKTNFFFFPDMLYLCFENICYKFSHNEIIEYISEANIDFIKNGTIFFSIPIGFFISLKNFTIKDNTFLIPLNFKMFFDNLIFKLNSSFSIYMVLPYQLNHLEFSMDIQIINTTLEIRKEFFIQHIQTSIFDMCNRYNLYNSYNSYDKYNPYIELITLKIDKKHPTKGFFITGDISSIYELILELNGIVRFSYENILLECICKKINENFFYVPLDINQKYEDCNFNSYSSSLNLSRMESVKFRIKFKKNIEKKVIIYSLSSNIITDNLELKFI